MLDKSPPEQLALFHQFIRQAITCFDPDTVQTFLEWQRDPVIDSILSLASKMDMEDRDQLLFVAEDMYEAD